MITKRWLFCSNQWWDFILTGTTPFFHLLSRCFKGIGAQKPISPTFSTWCFDRHNLPKLLCRNELFFPIAELKRNGSMDNLWQLGVVFPCVSQQWTPSKHVFRTFRDDMQDHASSMFDFLLSCGFRCVFSKKKCQPGSHILQVHHPSASQPRWWWLIVDSWPCWPWWWWFLHKALDGYCSYSFKPLFFGTPQLHHCQGRHRCFWASDSGMRVSSDLAKTGSKFRGLLLYRSVSFLSFLSLLHGSYHCSCPVY